MEMLGECKCKKFTYMKDVSVINGGLSCNNSIGTWRHLLSLFSSDEMIGNLSEN